MPMVKADGYGLGAVEVARALEAVQPWGYGVASTAEGQELRQAGITKPVLVLSPLIEELGEAAALSLTPALSNLEQVRAWFGVAGTERPFHVQIDTGMCRAGFWWEAFAAAQSAFSTAPGFEGAFTHFHSAESDPDSVVEQTERFRAAVAALPRRPRILHAANSAAALRYGDATGFDLVRPGIFLYGGAVGPDQPAPVVRWRARILEVNRRKAGVSVSYGATWRATGPVALATLAAGYADGLRRSLSSKGHALIGGRRFGIVGKVTMDMTVVSAREVTAAVDDIATLIGRDGDEEITVDEMALRAGTISYEILTGVGARVRKVYV